MEETLCRCALFFGLREDELKEALSAMQAEERC